MAIHKESFDQTLFRILRFLGFPAAAGLIVYYLYQRYQTEASERLKEKEERKNKKKRRWSVWGDYQFILLMLKWNRLPVLLTNYVDLIASSGFLSSLLFFLTNYKLSMLCFSKKKSCSCILYLAFDTINFTTLVILTLSHHPSCSVVLPDIFILI